MNLDLAELAAMRPCEARYERRRQLWLDGPHAGWDAYDRVLGRAVVLNVAYRAADAPQVVAKARVLALLQHRNILPVWDLGVTSEGLPFFSTPRLEGKTLDEFLRHRETSDTPATDPFPLRPLVAVVRDVCRALEYARGQGVVNGDLYPDNILVGNDFRDVIVLDGWEPIEEEGAAVDDGDRFGRMIGGRPAYMSPERVREWPATIRLASEVFCLGGILHLILYGTPPNHLPGHVGTLALVQAIMSGRFEPRRPGTLRPGLSPRGFWGRRAVRDLERICLRALDGDPRRRQRDAGELAGELDRWLGSP